jgi:hypothetical protein
MIAITGRLAMKNAQVKSDWDLLVVLQNGRIWTGRTLITLFSEALGKRRKREKIKDRVCLNYFITESALEIRNKDLYSANEYSFIFPLWGEEVFKNFQIKNSWISEYKPNYDSAETPNLKLLGPNKFFWFWQKIGERILGWNFIECWLRKIEKSKIENNPLTHQEGSLIVATDEALIFLPDPQGPKVFESFKRKIEELVLSHRTTF